jgi:copper chaperone NosL
MAKTVQRLDAFYAFLERPLLVWARPLLLLLLVPLGIGLTLPLWHVDFASPENPGGLLLDVYAYTVRGGHDGEDLRAINALHQMIGMKTVDAGSLSGLDWLPFGFGILALFTLRVAVLGNVRSLVDLAALAGYFTAFSLGHFVYKLHAYGHHLSADAPTKVPPFMPVISGTQQIGEVTARAGFGAGTYLVATFMIGVCVLAAYHLVVGRKKQVEREIAEAAGA